jgi:hypothetical protein
MTMSTASDRPQFGAAEIGALAVAQPSRRQQQLGGGEAAERALLAEDPCDKDATRAGARCSAPSRRGPQLV